MGTLVINEKLKHVVGCIYLLPKYLAIYLFPDPIMHKDYGEMYRVVTTGGGGGLFKVQWFKEQIF
jgi:hypothetical protein